VGAVSDSALVVLVPEADPLLAAVRRRHELAGTNGVPAHVTVLFPFGPPDDEATFARVDRVARVRAPFEVRFVALERFPGSVVWLRPEPSEPFGDLIHAAVAEFPDWPPYEGAVAEPVPHLTLAETVDDPTARAIEADVESQLPIRSHVRELVLLRDDGAGRWSVMRTWPLGAGSSGAKGSTR
jgi:2'-5' RNA ligase